MDLFTLKFAESVQVIVSRIDLTGRKINRFKWKNSYTRILKFLLEEKLLSRNDLIQMIHQRLLIVGEASYRQHKAGEYPDHTISPDAFAYALYHKKISLLRRFLIRYDRGDTEQSFISGYHTENLAEEVLDQLLRHTEQARSSLPESSDNTAFCVGCG